MQKFHPLFFSTLCSLSASLFSFNSQACGGLSSATITNVALLGGTSFEVDALGASGGVTGYSYTPGNRAVHAFLYQNGGVTDLGTLGGTFSEGFCVNSAGWVAGEAYLAGNRVSHAFLHDGSHMIDLGSLGGSYSSAIGINDSGQVAGNSLTTGDWTMDAFLYSNATMTDLGSLGGDFSFAIGLSQSGAVAGYSLTASYTYYHAFLYSNGTMQDLGSFGGDYSYPFAINDAGMVVGEAALANYNIHAFSFSNGTLTDLGTLGGTYSSARAVNNAGQIAGASTTLHDAQTHGFIYSHGSMTDLGTLGGTETTPIAMNNLGQIIGLSTTGNGDMHPFLWANGTMVDLYSLLPPNSSWELTYPQFINDSGRIVGQGTYQGMDLPFVLDLAAANHAPVAIAGPDQTVACPAVVTLDGSSSSDPDGDTLSYEWSAGGSVVGTEATFTGTFALGTTVMTLKVSDPCGLSAQTNVLVTVFDMTPPNISCPGPSSASSDANCQAAVPNLLPAVVISDNCALPGSLTLRQFPEPGTLVGLGDHAITFTVTDPSSNSATCSTVFSVIDNRPPTISCPGPSSASSDANCQAAVPNLLPGVVISDNCALPGSLTLRQIPEPGTLVGLGDHSITFTVTDPSGNSASCSTVFSVIDTSPPSIVSAPTALNLSVDSDCHATVPDLLAGLVVSDNCTPAGELTLSQDPVAGSFLQLGQHTVTIRVTDGAGNTTSKEIPVTVADVRPPVIQALSANPPLLSPPNHQMVPVTLSVTASDSCDAAPVCKITSITSNEPMSAGDIQITGNLTVSLAASRNPSGNGRIYTVTVQSCDASHNISTATIAITVPKGNSGK